MSQSRDPVASYIPFKLFLSTQLTCHSSHQLDSSERDSSSSGASVNYSLKTLKLLDSCCQRFCSFLLIAAELWDIANAPSSLPVSPVKIQVLDVQGNHLFLHPICAVRERQILNLQDADAEHCRHSTAVLVSLCRAQRLQKQLKGEILNTKHTVSC